MNPYNENGVLRLAATLGAKAFKQNRSCIPSYDQDLMDLLEGRHSGQPGKDGVTSLQILRAWSTAWHNANLMSDK